ncbi:hypothetical protein K7H92_15315 [Pseudomonas stutzeri]|nr:hypothetical protein [Stutzerimonas stutzeri]
MMPGVVAGFPKLAGIVLTSTGTGFAKNITGSLNPEYANVQPGAAAVQGASGEILELSWTAGTPNDPGYPDRVTLQVNGSFAAASAVPFTTLTVDGTTAFSKANAVFQSFGSNCSLTWRNVANPFPQGNHSLVFA